VHTGSRTFVGATPERHVSLTGGTAVMNPISGTYRYPPSGPTVAGVLEFLTDHKEAEELYMVADEELKMMADVCDEGGWLIGPGLKQMTRLAHTEYHIEGRTTHSPAEILHRTLLAPTVTGSPLRSACQVIRRHENRGRGYYGGIIGLIGLDGRGQPSLDSAILIRTADIDPQGSISVGVGATLVRHSDAATEVAETRAKVAGILGAMGVLGAQRASGASWSSGLADHPAVRRMLSSRNTSISAFWTTRPEARDGWGSAANGRVLVVDAEDTFTGMLGQLFRSMGMAVDISGYHAVHAPPTDVDLVVVGPGPGDPRITGDAKIARLRAITSELLGTGRPFLSICLGHQVLCSLLGLPLVRLSTPNQGVQRTVELFGRPERVGFYNTFAAQWHTDRFVSAAAPGLIEVSRDPLNGQVNALRGNSFASLQFHPESLLTQNGAQILRELVAQLLPGAVAA
jgi:phenazine biosynthesis protein phzE